MKILNPNLLVVSLLFPLSCGLVQAQTTKEKPSLHIQKAKGAIKIDGILNEDDWNAAVIASDFFQNYPNDTSYALTKTEVKVTYNIEFIFIGAICYDDIPGEFVIQSLKRDFSYPVSDAFAVYIDPFNDHLNGFSFAVNPLGVQREGLIQGGGGNFGVTTSWDNKWFSEVKHYDGYWIVEMAIPFKSIRYNAEAVIWGVNFSRNDLKRNESSSWSPVPTNFNIAALAFTGKMIWDNPPAKAGANIAFVPYAIGNTSEDYENNSPIEYGGNIGGDVKVAVSSSLNLDLTVNPDFSQVEVDRQQTNLTRFSLFFPEQRQFFIENSDLFSDFGFRQLRPFFSRNIGLYKGNAVPIIAGARLSGKVNKKLRIGLLNMQTNSDAGLELDAQNYSVAAFQQTVIGNSYIGGILVNRQAYNNNEFSANDYNRVAGLDFNLVSKNNKWQGKVLYHRSFSPENPDNSYAHASFLLHNTKHIFAMWNHEYAGENYNAEVGFVSRNKQYNSKTGKFEKTSYYRLEPSVELKFYPKSGPVNFHGPAIYINNYYDQNFNPTDLFYMPHYKVNFKNTAIVEVHYHEFFTKLLYDFDVTYSGGAPLPAGSYHYRNFLLKYDTDKRKRINGNLRLNYGGFYNGEILTINGELNYRQQPWGIFSLSFEQNEIRLPDSFANASISLIGPKFELSFTKSVFFTTFFQYNTQLNNVNINARFQWRFKPMSDLYIVYTDNYYSPDFAIKNRALVVKLIYWLNL